MWEIFKNRGCRKSKRKWNKTWPMESHQAKRTRLILVWLIMLQFLHMTIQTTTQVNNQIKTTWNQILILHFLKDNYFRIQTNPWQVKFHLLSLMRKLRLLRQITLKSSPLFRILGSLIKILLLKKMMNIKLSLVISLETEVA